VRLSNNIHRFGVRRRELLGSALAIPALTNCGKASTAVDPPGAERTIDVWAFGARGDGVADDRAPIQAAIDQVARAGGGTVIIPEGRFLLASALIPRSRVTIRGTDRRRSILQAAPGSADNVVGIDYLIEGQVAAAREGKVLNRLLSRTFEPIADQEARRTGGYAGYGVTDFHLRDLVIDGNKARCPENGNFLVAERIDGRFGVGETLRSSSGGKATVAATFPRGSPRGVSIRPSTIAGTGRFVVGDEIVGPSGRFILAGRRGDDAYQVGVVFHAATRCSMSGCTIQNTVYQAVVIYNGCNHIELSDNLIRDPNLSGTVYKAGNVHIYCDFDNAHLRIVGNELHGGGGYGIVVSENGGRTDGVLIANNIIVGTPGDAIRVASEGGSTSATITGISITGNRIDDCGDTAIRLVHNGRENGILGPVVSGNRIHDANFGILFAGHVRQAQVHGNKLSGIKGVALDLGHGPIDISMQ